ncbi:hypothetical protein NPIL_600781 [Nephila pilipes]|uniref:Uncharacterized protein n=1 Tax=Nephila pilipes TaxID=299642 RepID=A0A8X6MJJ6_NEPPI|nr:hypothetical protein NPIL_292821 [Nephila pilipes]GFT36901.1 hypothetical protein NPIL_81021 [Nephila pilipes]GFT63899.1 hypothetical protein NPIL_173991 [Nephila pilipes]GFT88803.1 hypothetical protein NPIL_600781 [Nephila pilipes]
MRLFRTLVQWIRRILTGRFLLRLQPTRLKRRLICPVRRRFNFWLVVEESRCNFKEFISGYNYCQNNRNIPESKDIVCHLILKVILRR